MQTHQISWVLADYPNTKRHTVEGDSIHHDIGRESHTHMQAGDLADDTEGTDIVVMRDGEEALALRVPAEAVVWIETEE